MRNFSKWCGDHLQRTQVISTRIHSIGYNRDSQILEIEFHKGSIYHYFGVPESVFNELMSASSKGRFLTYRIERTYRYQPIV